MKKQTLQPKVVTAETVLVTVRIANAAIIVRVTDVPAVANAASKNETALLNEGCFYFKRYSYISRTAFGLFSFHRHPYSLAMRSELRCIHTLYRCYTIGEISRMRNQ